MRRGDDEGDSSGEFVVVGFGPDALFAEVDAVVAPEDDDGVVRQAELIEFVEEAADLGVDVAHASVVAVAEALREGGIKGEFFGDVAIAFEFFPGLLPG